MSVFQNILPYDATWFPWNHACPPSYSTQNQEIMLDPSNWNWIEEIKIMYTENFILTH